MLISLCYAMTFTFDIRKDIANAYKCGVNICTSRPTLLWEKA